MAKLTEFAVRASIIIYSKRNARRIVQPRLAETFSGRLAGAYRGIATYNAHLHAHHALSEAGGERLCFHIVLSSANFEPAVSESPFGDTAAARHAWPPPNRM